MAYQPGVGKTYTAMEYIASHPDTFYFTERHETIQELSSEQGINFEFTHWKGFERSCSNKNAIAASKQYPTLPKRLLCDRCRASSSNKFNSCEYPNQFNNRTRVFGPLNYLMIASQNPPSTIIVDEGINIAKFRTANKDKLIEALQILNMSSTYRAALEDDNFRFFNSTKSDVLPAMNGGASYEAEGWRKEVNVV